MTARAEILTIMEDIIRHMDSEVTIRPDSIALGVYSQISYKDEQIDPLLEYASLEHLKQLARSALAGKFNPATDTSSPATEDMFDGVLQKRYPVKHTPKEQPVYKLRSSMTPEELRWNAEQLEKSGQARLKHARALLAEAERLERSVSA